MLKTEYFKTKDGLVSWVNNVPYEVKIVSIVKDVTDGLWYLFYY